MPIQELPERWRSVADLILDDSDGEQIVAARRAWNEAARIEISLWDVTSDVGPDVFGPGLIPAGGVVTRSHVVVTAPSDQLLTACRAAWDRWWNVDEAGVEHAGPVRDLEPFGEPSRAAGGYVLGVDLREIEDPVPLLGARCLVILLDELASAGAFPVSIRNVIVLPGDE